MLKNPNKRLLLALMAIVLIAGMIASRIQTSGGRVVVNDIKIPTQNGQWVVGDLFGGRKGGRAVGCPVSATTGTYAPPTEG